MISPLLLGSIAMGTGRAIATATDPMLREAKRRQRELEGDISAGIGLNQGEQAQMTNTAMAPVRATTGSMASELARLQASSGGYGGGAAAAQARDSMANQLGRQAETVGARVAAADRDTLLAKQQEVRDIQAQRSEARSKLLSDLTAIGTTAIGAAGEQAGAVQPDGTDSRDAPILDQLLKLLFPQRYRTDARPDLTKLGWSPQGV